MGVTVEDLRASGSLRDCAPLLDDRAALDEAMDRDGYLYLRGVIDRDAVTAARRAVFAVLARAGVLSGDADDATWTGRSTTRPELFGLNAFTAELSAEGIWERLAEHPSVRDTIERALGEPIRYLPNAEYRTVMPGAATGIHQDGYYNPGYELHTAWIPLEEIGEELGGLALVPGSHRHGLVAVTGNPPQVAVDAVPEAQWHRADYSPGDLVVFRDEVLHMGLCNRTPDRLRHSIELRFQTRSAPQAVYGPVVEVTGSSFTVRDDAGLVTLQIGPDTYIRAKHVEEFTPDAIASILPPGATVMASQKDGTAVSVSVRPT